MSRSLIAALVLAALTPAGPVTTRLSRRLPRRCTARRPRPRGPVLKTRYPR